MGTGIDQFALYDVRKSSSSPALTFGFRLPAKKSTTTHAPLAPNLGRYHRGSFRDFDYAHPDNETGIKLWDLRSVKEGEIPRSQSMAGAGSSKVVQSTFKGRDELALLEYSNFTSIRIR
jgi:hypothetical protein